MLTLEKLRKALEAIFTQEPVVYGYSSNTLIIDKLHGPVASARLEVLPQGDVFGDATEGELRDLRGDYGEGAPPLGGRDESQRREVEWNDLS